MATNYPPGPTEEEDNQEELVTIDLEEELFADIGTAMMAEEGTVERVPVSGSHLHSSSSGNSSTEEKEGLASTAHLWPLFCPSPSAPNFLPSVQPAEESSCHSPLSSCQADPILSVELVWVYLLSVMPEKAKLIWAVFFTLVPHSLDHFVLRLMDYDGKHKDITLSANMCHSWTTTDPESQLNEGGQSNQHGLQLSGAIYQYKVAFDCPDSTFNGIIFRAYLVNTASGLCVDLGPLSIVSTASQRERRSAKLKQRSPSKAHERLAVNFKDHPRNKRHYKNGKGGGQENWRGLPFQSEELALAVSLLAEQRRG